MYKSFLLLFTLCCFRLTLSAQDMHIPDSLLNERYIQKLQLTNPQHALELLDEVERRQVADFPRYRQLALRSTCYGTMGDTDRREQYARLALADDSVKLVPSRKLKVMLMLADALQMGDKYEECISVCEQAIGLARENKNRLVEAHTLIQMGHVCQLLQRLNEAADSYRASIALLEKSEKVQAMAQLSLAYGELSTILLQMERPADAVQTGQKRLNLIERMSGLAGPPPGYIDQQRGYTQAKLALALLRCGRANEAAIARDAFMKTHFAAKPEGADEIVPYFLEAGQYAAALAQLRLADQLVNGDTIHSSYSEHLRQYACAYRGLKRYEEADAFQQRYGVIQDSLSNRKITGQAHKLATQFRLNEKERQLQEANALAEQRVMLLIFSLIIAFMLVLLLLVIALNLRKSMRQNRIIAKQIDELLAQREELRRSTAEEAKSDSSHQEMTEEYAAFLRMERAVVDQKLFLQPDFGRDDLLVNASFGKNDLVRILQKYSNAHNVSEYLGRLRVEHAVRIMKENPKFSMDAVLEESGFNSRTTFYRTFYKVFGMTPTQYMKSLKE